MELYFVRHAQSENNASFARQGEGADRLADPELTEIGQQQAELVAHYLARPVVESAGHTFDQQNSDGFGLTHLYCSLMIRSIETGMAAAQACRLPLVAWPEIHERGGIYLMNQATGEREGLPGNSRSYLKTRFPELVLPDEVDEVGWWNRPAETFAEADARARLVLDKLLERHGGTEDRVGIVSHGGFFQAFMLALLNMPVQLTYTDRERTPQFGINNVSISRFVFIEQTVGIVYLNNTRFLPAEYFT